MGILTLQDPLSTSQILTVVSLLAVINKDSLGKTLMLFMESMCAL